MNRIHASGEGRRVQRSGQGILEGPPISALEFREVAQPGHHRRVAAEERGGVPIAADVKDEVNVPGDQHPRALLRLVGVHVLPAVVTVAVPVAHDALHGQDAHPLLNVHRARDPRPVGLRLRRVHGVHKREEVGEIVRRFAHGARAPRPAVARRLLRPPGGGEVLQRGVHVPEHVVTRVVELEPILDLVQAAGVVVGEELLHNLAIRLLRILIDVAALLAVEEYPDVAPVQIGRTQLASDPERGLLGLVGWVAVQVANRGQHEIIRAQNRVVLGQIQLIVAGTRHRPGITGGVPRTAAVERAGVVTDPRIAVHERHVQRMIALLLARRPAVHVFLRHPQPVRAQYWQARRFAKAHEALAIRRVGGKTANNRRRAGILRLQVKSHPHPGGLAGNCARVQARAPIGEWEGDEVGVRIHPILERGGRQPVRVLDLGRDRDRLAGGRQHGPMADGGDGRTGVGQESRVARSRRAKGLGGQDAAGGLQPVAVQAEQDFGMPLQPLHAGAQRGGGALRERLREDGANAVCSGVPAAGGDDAQTPAAVTAAGLPHGVLVRALHVPAVGVAVKGAVDHHVRAALGNDLDVVHEAFALAEQKQLQLIGIGHRPPIQQAGEFHQRPTALGRFVAVRPIRRPVSIAARVGALQAAAAAIRPAAPATARRVRQFVHGDVNLVRDELPELVGGNQVVQFRQPHRVSAIAQLAAVFTEDQRRIEAGLRQQEIRPAAGHHRVAAGSQTGARRKVETDPAAQPPAGQVHRIRAAIVDFHKLVVVVFGDRMVVQFIDDHIAEQRAGVGIAEGGLAQPAKRGRSIGVAAKRHAVLLRLEAQRVHHAAAVGRDQIDRLAGGIQGEAKLGLGKGQPAQRRDAGPGRNNEPVRCWIVREDAVAQVHRTGAVIKQLDVVLQRRVRMREDFVDQDRAARIGSGRVRRSGRTAHPIAGGPGPRFALAVGRPRQHQRVAGAVRRNRPRRLIIVSHLQQHGIQLVAETDCAAAVVEDVGGVARRGIGERPEDVRQAEDSLKVRRSGSDDAVTLRRDGRSRRERVVHAAREPVTAQVFGPRCGIVDLDELQVAPVCPVGRVIHDLGDGEGGAAAGGAGGLVGADHVPDIQRGVACGKRKLAVRQDGVRRLCAIPDVVDGERVVKGGIERSRPERHHGRILQQEHPQHTGAVVQRVVAGQPRRSRFDRFGERHHQKLVVAQVSHRNQRRARSVRKHGQRGGGAIAPTESVGDRAEEGAAAVAQPHRRQGAGAGSGAGEICAVALPLVAGANRAGELHAEGGSAALGHRDVDGLLDENGRPQTIRDAARGGDRFLHRARRQPPAHGQVVPAAAFLHQGLDVIALSRRERNQARLLAAFPVPGARGRPPRHAGDQAFLRRAFVRAQIQLRGVVAGNPKPVIAGGGRGDERLQALAVVVVGVNRRF